MTQTTNFEAMAMMLGQNLAKQRHRIGLTQKQLATGICTQGLISNIERGNYVLNAILLASLCERLKMSVDHALLNDYYRVSQHEAFNNKVELLCNQHLYAALVAYLDDSQVLNDLTTDEDLQIYYYYHACGVYQLTKDAQTALRELTLALSFTMSDTSQSQQIRGLEILIFACINFIESESTHIDDFSHFDQAITAIEKTSNYNIDKNFNLVFYQYALALFHREHIAESVNMLEKGINWATNHDATFMLADFFFLLAQEYTQIHDNEQATTATQKYQALTDVFKQPVNRDV